MLRCQLREFGRKTEISPNAYACFYPRGSAERPVCNSLEGLQGECAGLSLNLPTLKARDEPRVVSAATPRLD
jgi:hypothetical protein